MESPQVPDVRMIHCFADEGGDPIAAPGEAFLRALGRPRVYLGVGTLFRGACERARREVWRGESAELARLLVRQPWAMQRARHLGPGADTVAEGRWLSTSVGVVLVLVPDFQSLSLVDGQALRIVDLAPGSYELIASRDTVPL